MKLLCVMQEKKICGLLRSYGGRLWNSGMLHRTGWDTSLDHDVTKLTHFFARMDFFVLVEEEAKFLSKLVWSETETVCSTLKAELEEISWKHALRTVRNHQRVWTDTDHGIEGSGQVYMGS